MRRLSKEEIMNVSGGSDFTSGMLTAIYKTIQVIFDVGEALGNFIRRKASNKMCDL